MTTKSPFSVAPQLHATWHSPSAGPSGHLLDSKRIREKALAKRHTSSPDASSPTRGSWPFEEKTATTAPAIRKVLVPLDGTAVGEHALPMALYVARMAGAEIDLVYVNRRRHPPFLGGRKSRREAFNMLLMRPMYEYLDDVCKRIARVSSVRSNLLLLERPSISDALYEVAAAKADLVVMATRARRGISRLVMGSIAETLVHEAPAPVLLVRGTKTQVDLESVPPMRHALVPLDGSPGSERIVAPLIALGQLGESEQTLLRVLPFPRYSPVLRTCFSVCEAGAEHQDRALSGLEKTAHGLRSRLPLVHTDVVFSDNSPATEILLQANSRKVDLIAVATRRRSSRLSRLFEGGVADTLMRKANVPLLITRRRSD